MPQYLFNRPRHIVQHCLEKIDLAKSIPAHHVVNKGQGQFKVHSQTVVNMWYHVSFGGNNEPPLNGKAATFLGNTCLQFSDSILTGV